MRSDHDRSAACAACLASWAASALAATARTAASSPRAAVSRAATAGFVAFLLPSAAACSTRTQRSTGRRGEGGQVVSGQAEPAGGPAQVEDRPGDGLEVAPNAGPRPVEGRGAPGPNPRGPPGRRTGRGDDRRPPGGRGPREAPSNAPRGCEQGRDPLRRGPPCPAPGGRGSGRQAETSGAAPGRSSIVAASAAGGRSRQQGVGQRLDGRPGQLGQGFEDPGRVAALADATERVVELGVGLRGLVADQGEVRLQRVGPEQAAGGFLGRDGQRLVLVPGDQPEQQVVRGRVVVVPQQLDGLHAVVVRLVGRPLADELPALGVVEVPEPLQGVQGEVIVAPGVPLQELEDLGRSAGLAEVADGLGRLLLEGVPLLGGELQQDVQGPLVGQCPQRVTARTADGEVAGEVDRGEQDVEALGASRRPAPRAARTGSGGRGVGGHERLLVSRALAAASPGASTAPRRTRRRVIGPSVPVSVRPLCPGPIGRFQQPRQRSAVPRAKLFSRRRASKSSGGGADSPASGGHRAGRRRGRRWIDRSELRAGRVEGGLAPLGLAVHQGQDAVGLLRAAEVAGGADDRLQGRAAGVVLDAVEEGVRTACAEFALDGEGREIASQFGGGPLDQGLECGLVLFEGQAHGGRLPHLPVAQLERLRSSLGADFSLSYCSASQPTARLRSGSCPASRGGGGS